MPSPEVHPLTVELAGHTSRVEEDVLALVARLVAAGMDIPTVAPELVAELAILRGEAAAILTVGDAARTIYAATEEAVSLPRIASLLNEPAVLAAATTAATGTGDSDLSAMRLARLSRSVVARAAQDGRAETIKRAKTVRGWVRGVDSDSCELCRWWWRDGRVWPKSHHMPTHPGCTCVQLPAMDRASNVSVSRRAGLDSDYRRELAARGTLDSRFGTGRVTR